MTNNLLLAGSVVTVSSAFEPLLTMSRTNCGRFNRIRCCFCHQRPPLISPHLPNKGWHHSCLQHTFLWVKKEKKKRRKKRAELHDGHGNAIWKVKKEHGGGSFISTDISVSVFPMGNAGRNPSIYTRDFLYLNLTPILYLCSQHRIWTCWLARL